MANITNVKVEKVDEKWATDPSFNVSLSDCYMIAEYVVGINGENVGINVEYYSGKGRIIAVDKRVLCTAEVKDNAISLAFDGDADLNVQLQAKIWYDDDTTDIRCSLTVNGVEDGFCSREESQRVADDWILSQRSLPPLAHNNYAHFVYDVRDALENRLSVTNIYWVVGFEDDYSTVRVADFSGKPLGEIPKEDEIRSGIIEGKYVVLTLTTGALLSGVSDNCDTAVVNYPAMKEFFAANADTQYDDLVSDVYGILDNADYDTEYPYVESADDEADFDDEDVFDAYDDYDDYDGVDYFEPIDEYSSLIDDE